MNEKICLIISHIKKLIYAIIYTNSTIERMTIMARVQDHFTAWFNQLRYEDKINQALLDLSRNESRMMYLYQRNVRLTPPIISVSNNAETVSQINQLIINDVHKIIDLEGYLEHLMLNVPYSDVQQVVLDDHIRKEKMRLARWVHLLNVLVVHTYDVRNLKNQRAKQRAVV